MVRNASSSDPGMGLGNGVEPLRSAFRDLTKIIFRLNSLFQTDVEMGYTTDDLVFLILSIPLCLGTMYFINLFP